MKTAVACSLDLEYEDMDGDTHISDTVGSLAS